jgi:hypothetical protein
MVLARHGKAHHRRSEQRRRCLLTRPKRQEVASIRVVPGNLLNQAVSIESDGVDRHVRVRLARRFLAATSDGRRLSFFCQPLVGLAVGERAVTLETVLVGFEAVLR